MNKTAIKNFAIWARRKLIADITYKAGLIGVTEKGIATALPQSKSDLQFFDIGTKNYSEVSGKAVEQRAALVSAIRSRERTSDYKTAFQNVIEEVAYTWFNRLIAVRFMEVNDYLPSRLRVLSSETPKKNEPDFVTTPFDTDLEFTPYERDRVLQLKDENKLDELFRMLFIKQCNKLREILPRLFEKTNDFTELLLSISFTDTDDVVYHLTHDIPEDDFNVSKEGQVEIIGWLYQYYNTEPKEEVFALLKKNVKITKERIPAATQLFTPDWIVRYMVENSLGRLWIDHMNGMYHKQMPFRYPDYTPEEVARINALKSNWRYYLDEAEQEPEVESRLRSLRAELSDLNPEEIKVIDPCLGSGHILVYAFDVLVQIYVNNGYTQRDAAHLIIENNLYGLDIDRRACQLAYFALMMKARQYDRRFFSRHTDPHVHLIIESNELVSLEPEGWHFDKVHLATAKYLADVFSDAKEYGSIVHVENRDYDGLQFYLEKVSENTNDAMLTQDLSFLGWANTDLRILFRLVEQAKLMAQKYHVVCTNPPYMGSSGMSAKLSDYVKAQYPDSKSDLFAVFMERCGQMTAKNCYQAMITQHAWMFLSSFEKLRGKLLQNDTVNMAHLGARAFEEIGGEVVQTTSFVLRNPHIKNYKGVYCRLVEPTSQKGKEDMFLGGENRFESTQDNFSKIPGSPIAYWVSLKMADAFSNSKIGDLGKPKQGMIPGNVDEFVRLWFEVGFNRIGLNHKCGEDIIKKRYKWFPYNKGGSFRRWFGNIEHLINMENNGYDIKYSGKNNNYRLREPELYFQEAITWSKISSGSFSARYMPSGYLFDIAGCCIFELDAKLLYVLAYLNSKVNTNVLGLISPTLNYEVDHIKKLPVCIDDSKILEVNSIVEPNIELSKLDWNSFETSWDFTEHPIVKWSKKLWDCTSIGATMSYYYGDKKPKEVSSPVELCFLLWQGECNERFNTLKANEEELNRIFIDIYGLQDELTPEVEDKDVTVRKADLQRDIRSLISYAVGCMLGRYSLDVDGLAYAGGEWDDSKYKTFIPDADNCIPITDEEYFEDDIVGRFVTFIRTVYGAETLEENLDFIASALGNKGNTSREVIRNYFLSDFFKNHCQIYQKRPIYWLFDSGKQNGFKALCYTHRWNSDTTGNVRVEYLHRTQRVYEKEIERMQETIDNSRNAREVATAEKRKEKLIKQLKEAKDYDAKIAHLALSRIDIDLDDGVKVNYENVQTGQDGKKIEILAKI